MTTVCARSGALPGRAPPPPLPAPAVAPNAQSALPAAPSCAHTHRAMHGGGCTPIDHARQSIHQPSCPAHVHVQRTSAAGAVPPPLQLPAASRPLALSPLMPCSRTCSARGASAALMASGLACASSPAAACAASKGARDDARRGDCQCATAARAARACSMRLRLLRPRNPASPESTCAYCRGPRSSKPRHRSPDTTSLARFLPSGNLSQQVCGRGPAGVVPIHHARARAGLHTCACSKPEHHGATIQFHCTPVPTGATQRTWQHWVAHQYARPVAGSSAISRALPSVMITCT